MNAALIERLAARLGPKGYSTDPDIIAPYLVEWRRRFQGRTPFLAMPASTEEVSDIVKLCAQAGAAITPQGGNTGVVGGQIPDGEILVSTKRINKIRSLAALDDALIAEAGVTLSAVQNAAAEADRLFPLSLASQDSATIGGLVSTNAGGVHVVRYGMMRDLVLGLEVVLADGSVHEGLSVLRKDNTGYDLKQNFIGAEGTLGIVTAASLKLFARPRAHVVALTEVPSPDHALALLHRAKAETGALSAFEMMNRLSVALVAKNLPDRRDPMPGAAFMALLEFESADSGLRDLVEAMLASALESGEATQVLIAESETQARAFWAVREGISAGHRSEGAQVNHDISVPVSKTPLFLEQAGAALAHLYPGVRIVAFGHMGDGNLHYTAMQAVGADAAAFPREAISARVNEIAVSMGGSISAEHGIGVARRADFARFKDPRAIVLMRAIKAALDPKSVMNPRALLP